MRFRRAAALHCQFGGEGFVVENFLTKRAFVATEACLGLLQRAGAWLEPEELVAGLSRYTGDSVLREVRRLVELDALLVEGSDAARLDEEYRRTWEWGAFAGLLHFGTKDPRYMSYDDAIEWIRARKKERDSPPLYSLNDGYPLAVRLPDPCASPRLESMVARRSVREFDAAPLGQDELSECLFAGLGITGFIEDPDFGKLPLKSSPSGGARNPYEAYVWAANVTDLPAGIYHYSAFERTLGFVSALPPVPVGEILGAQPWADDAAAVVFLVAHFDRTMWKYADAGAYGVVLIEAGHIAQNILLVASQARLAAAPTAAICDSLAERALGIRSLCQAVIYAVAIGKRAGGV
jgi:SagB-type dehydrogenase family enzyme